METMALAMFGIFGVASIFIISKAWQDGYERGREEGYRAGLRTATEEVTQVIDAEHKEAK